MSRFARARKTVDPKSCSVEEEPFGPGRIALPPPASSATSVVYRMPASLPVSRPPHRGEVIAARQAPETGQRSLTANRAVAAAREPGGRKLIAETAWIIAVEQDAPRLRLCHLVSERRKGNADFERPPAVADLRRRVPEV